MKHNQKIRKSQSPRLKKIINPKKDLKSGLSVLKNGLAASVLSVKKENRSRLGSFETLKPKLVQQVKLGLGSATRKFKPVITA